METRCPECHSDKVIPWDDGYICCDCGIEFDEVIRQTFDEDYQ